jgi:hypothetical protein
MLTIEILLTCDPRKFSYSRKRSDPKNLTHEFGPMLQATQNPEDSVHLSLDDLRKIARGDMAKQGLRPA